MAKYFFPLIALLFISALAAGLLAFLSAIGLVPLDTKVLLSIVGVLFLAMVLSLIGAGFYVRFLIRRAGEKFAEVLSVVQQQPLEIHLETDDTIIWPDADAAEQAFHQLQAIGYTAGSDYRIIELPGIPIRPFFHRQWGRPMAAVYQPPIAGVVIDVVGAFADGGSVTVSNAPTGHELDPPPRHEKHYFAGADVKTLAAEFARILAGRTLIEVGPADFPAFFEECWKETMHWRASRGGVTETEIRRIAAESGTPVSDEIIDLGREISRQQFSAPPGGRENSIE